MAPEKQTNKRFHLEVMKQMVTLASSGLGLVAALAWNNVIQDIINTFVKPYLPQGSSIVSLLLYAVAITILAVSVTYQLTKIVEKLEK